MTNMTTDKPGSKLKATEPDKSDLKAAGKAEQAAGSKTYVDPINSPVAQNAPKNDDDGRVFAQGRTAALGSIGADDAPYDKSDPNHAVWLKGHKSVTG